MAQLAGVSTGTVSKYINGKHIGEKNFQKIKNAIEKLDYSPSPLARSFASGKSHMVLLYIIAEAPMMMSTWQYELPVIHGIMDALKGSAYSLKIEIAELQNVEENRRKLDMYAQNQYSDGIIFLSPWYVDDNLLIPLQYHKFPYIVVGACKENYSSGCVDFDNEAPICQIVENMYAQGCRRFCMIGGFAEQYHMIYRERGFRRAIDKLGLQMKEEMIRYTDYSLRQGYEAARELLTASLLPDAIVCGNDNIAAGVLRAVSEKGLRIPEDILISGFDNEVVSDACCPSITSVSIPEYELGLLAGKELMHCIEDPNYVASNHLLECQVYQKESTKRCVEREIDS